MLRDEFLIIVDEAKKQIDKTLIEKNNEYANEKDVLKNFNEAKHLIINQKSAAAAAWNFNVKHLISIKDLIENTEKVTKENLNEKFGDAINYLLLIKAALIAEK
jgi:ATP phosphoribosyltransferase